MDKLTSKFQFTKYKINYIEYTENDSFEQGKPVQIELKLNTIVGISDDSNNGTLTLETSIFENFKDNNYPFSLKISLTGFFTAENDMPKEDFTKFLEINGTATLFPFLRSSIADITRTANIEPLILPLVNIHNLKHPK